MRKLKIASIAASSLLVVAALVIQTLILVELRSEGVEVSNPEFTVLNPALGVTVLNPVEEVAVSNPVDEVTVLNPVEEVTVSNPVRDVIVRNPVRSVSISEPVVVSHIEFPVQTGVTWVNAEMFGRCTIRGNQYDLKITALAGGERHTLADGRFSGEVANLIGQYFAQHYYDQSSLNFGESSEGCSGLQGWK